MAEAPTLLERVLLAETREQLEALTSEVDPSADQAVMEILYMKLVLL